MMIQKKTVTHAILIAVLGLTFMVTTVYAGAPVAGTVTLGTTMEVTRRSPWATGRQRLSAPPSTTSRGS